MAPQKRNVVDDLTRRLRGLLDDMDRSLDRLLNPQPTPKPARVPIPVPVRPEGRRPQRDDPYR